VQAHAPTVAIGTPFHTWQVVAQGKQPAAHKAMVHVAKAMAATGAAVLSDPALMDAAKADHRKRLGKDGYTSPLPPEVKPPLTMSLGG
jgi:aminobenzoyl-glutamate utilization protein B